MNFLANPMQWQAVLLGLHTQYVYPLLSFFSAEHSFSYFVSLLFISLYQSGGRKHLGY